MWKISDKLIARGYWDVAGDGTDLPGQGGTGDDPGVGEGQGAGEGGQGDEGGEGSDDPAGDDKPAGDKPTDEVAKLVKEVMKRKEQLKQTQDELKKVQAVAKQFEGLDPEAVRKLIEDAKSAETKKLEEKGQWDALKKQMNDAHQTEVKKLTDQLGELQAKLGESSSVVEKLTVGHAFDSSKFISEELTLTPAKARIVYGAHFEIENGEVIAYDKPRGAEGRNMLVSGTGDSLSFEEAIRKIVDSDPDRDRLVRSKVRPGADSKTMPAKAPEKKQDLRGAERIAASLAKSSGA
jgi:uncharacterized tellurite resistance protein B-like protein